MAMAAVALAAAAAAAADAAARAAAAAPVAPQPVMRFPPPEDLRENQSSHFSKQHMSPLVPHCDDVTHSEGRGQRSMEGASLGCVSVYVTPIPL